MAPGGGGHVDTLAGRVGGRDDQVVRRCGCRRHRSQRAARAWQEAGRSSARSVRRRRRPPARRWPSARHRPRTCPRRSFDRRCPRPRERARRSAAGCRRPRSPRRTSHRTAPGAAQSARARRCPPRAGAGLHTKPESVRSSVSSSGTSPFTVKSAPDTESVRSMTISTRRPSAASRLRWSPAVTPSNSTGTRVAPQHLPCEEGEHADEADDDERVADRHPPPRPVAQGPIGAEAGAGISERRRPVSVDDRPATARATAEQRRPEARRTTWGRCAGDAGEVDGHGEITGRTASALRNQSLSRLSGESTTQPRASPAVRARDRSRF